MTAKEVECPKCRTKIAAEKLALVDNLPCYGCGNTLSGTVFPAIDLTKREKPSLSNPATGEDAVCFYRSDQRASTVCAQCGVFISEMHRVRVGDEDFCTNCVAKSYDTNNIPALRTRSSLKDYQALLWAILPLILFFPIVILTAPYAFFLVIRHRNNTGGIIKRSNWRMPVAGILAVVEFIGIIALGIVVWQEMI